MIMKKNFLPIIALALSATACVSDADLDVADNKGYINVSVSADNSMETRASQEVTNFDKWTIKVGETVWTSSTQGISAGTYTVTATNYATIEDALAANAPYGEAWYSGKKESVQITAGKQTSVSIDCGKAKNARVRADIQSGMPSISDVEIKVYKTGDTRRQPVLSTTNTTAYFEASTAESSVSVSITYVISYKYGNNSNRTELPTKTLTLGKAAQENVIKITSNTNGSINISVSYDNTFDNGGEESITIDAATGNEVNS